MSDITGVEFTLTRVDDGEQGQDGKSAYESAVDGGYTGTEAEFNDALAQASDAVQYFWTDNDGVHVTQIPQDEYLADPANAGINILINSTSGLQILDGVTVLAFYSATAMIGDPNGAHVEVTSEGVTITSPDGDAFTVRQGAGSQQIEVTQSINESSVASPFSFTADGLADAISGTTITMSCSEYVSGTTNNPTFTKGTTSTVVLTRGRIYYDGSTGFIFYDFAPTKRFRCYNVKYYANKIVPQITIQGETIMQGSLSLNGDDVNEVVTEQGVKAGNHGTWFYRKWSSGMIEAWYNMDTAISVNFNSSSSVAGTYRKDSAITIPSGIFPAKPNFGMVNVQQDSTTIHGEFHPVSATSGTVYWTRDATGTANITASIYISLIPQRP